MRTTFLSSTSKDLQAYRNAVYNALCQLEDWHCYRMESFTARANASVLDYCREKAGECDVLIGLVGHCYGSVPKGEELSYTEQEYDAAAAKSRLMFIAPDNFAVAASLLNEQSRQHQLKQKLFRRRVRNADEVPGPPDCFDSPDKLAGAVVAALRNWEQKFGQTPTRTLAGTRVGVDPINLPDGSVFREVDTLWCPEMVIVPAGRFFMGSPDDDPDAYPEEKPRHEVVISDRFALGRYPVTFEEFDAFCAAASRPKPSDEGWRRGRHPVINVSWNDAYAFAEWLAGMTKKPYRLPTEAEWEYACRAGTITRFYRGNQITVKHANHDMAAGRTTEVGSYPSNRWGLYDMHGNVWEHVEDPYHDDYIDAPADGSAWIGGGDLTRRVVRGGSYSYPARDNRAAVRCDHDAATPDRQHGFRVARTL